MEKEFAHYIKTDEITFKHAKGMRDIIGKEFHTFHEIFLFLGGSAQFTSDTLKITLEPGTLVIIPRESFHQFTCSKDTEYHRCVFNFNKVAALDVLITQKLCGVYTVPISSELYTQFTELFDYAKNAPDSIESKVLTHSLLARLLCYLKPAPTPASITETLHPLVVGAVNYIHENIRNPISVFDIAENLHISPSYLMRIFKADLHISIYRYITEKRLTLAAGEIEKGIPPSKAATLSGFNDYSGFYKLFKKMFGVSPSKYV